MTMRRMSLRPPQVAQGRCVLSASTRRPSFGWDLGTNYKPEIRATEQWTCGRGELKVA